MRAGDVPRSVHWSKSVHSAFKGGASGLTRGETEDSQQRKSAVRCWCGRVSYRAERGCDEGCLRKIARRRRASSRAAKSWRAETAGAHGCWKVLKGQAVPKFVRS